MIDHTKCDHPSTSGARAKCRRSQDPSKPKTKVMGKREPKDKDPDDNYGQTPRDRALECDNCGVERIAYKGTDPLTGILKFVGERCKYIVARSSDITPLD